MGRSFALLKDNGATWNAGSPSIEIEIVAASVPIGQLGVQGWRLDSTNPNDDSLSVWLEWMDVPAVGAHLIPAYVYPSSPKPRHKSAKASAPKATG